MSVTQDYFNFFKKLANQPRSYDLTGRFVVLSNGWGVVEVPSSLVQGVFDALNTPGVELPETTSNRSRYYIPVFSASEIQKIGGPEKISERGHFFKYTLGFLRSTNSLPTHNKFSKVWFIEVKSPELEQLRKSYGLSPKILNKYSFYIVVAVRKRGVLNNSPTQKTAQTKHANLIPGLSNASNALTSFIYTFGAPIFMPWLQRHGYVPALGPGSNVVDKLLWQDYMRRYFALRESPALKQQAKEKLKEFILGIFKLLGQDTNNAEINKFLDAISSDALSIVNTLSYFAPELSEYFYGSAGSIFNLGKGILEGNLLRIDPKTGLPRYDINYTENLTKNLYQKIKSNPEQFGGLSSYQIGSLYKKLVPYGLITKPDNSEDKTNINKWMNEMASWSQATTAGGQLLNDVKLNPTPAGFSGIFKAPESTSNPTNDDLLRLASKLGLLKNSSDKNFDLEKIALDADDNIISLFRQLFGNKLENVDPKDLALFIHTLRQFQNHIPGGINTLANLIVQGNNAAAAQGLSYPVGPTAALHAAALYANINETIRSLNMTGLSRDELLVLANQLVINAATSPLANAAGATLSLYRNGFIKPGTLGDELAKAIESGSFVTESGVSLNRMNPTTWVTIMSQSGVPAALAWDQLQDRNINVQQIISTPTAAPLLIQIRNAQWHFDVAPTLKELFNSSIVNFLFKQRPEHAVGSSPNYISYVSNILSDVLMNQMFDIDLNLLAAGGPELLDNLAHRVVRQIRELAKDQKDPNVNDYLLNLDPPDLKPIIQRALIYSNFVIANDPRFSQYKNLPSFIALHRPDILNNSLITLAANVNIAGLSRALQHNTQMDTPRRLTEQIIRIGSGLDKPSFASFVAPLLSTYKIEDINKSIDDFVVKNPWVKYLTEEQRKTLSGSIADIKNRLMFNQLNLNQPNKQVIDNKNNTNNTNKINLIETTKKLFEGSAAPGNNFNNGTNGNNLIPAPPKPNLPQ
jgi:hypothetical protein